MTAALRCQQIQMRLPASIMTAVVCWVLPSAKECDNGYHSEQQHFKQGGVLLQSTVTH
jgi:hypothetical protein